MQMWCFASLGLVVRPGSTDLVWVSHTFFYTEIIMKEISIFIDESGDFGKFNPNSPFYIVTMVFHDQETDISASLESLEQELSYLGYPNHCLHAGPIIRMEDEFKNEDIVVRRKLLMKQMGFIRKIKIQHKSFYVDRRQAIDKTDITLKLSKQIGTWIKNNYDYLLKYDHIKIYYDNGQSELSRILGTVFNVLLPSIEIKKVLPSEYRLFQVADFICTMKLTDLKVCEHRLSTQESRFFGGETNLRKNYFKDLKKYEIE